MPTVYVDLCISPFVDVIIELRCLCDCSSVHLFQNLSVFNLFVCKNKIIIMLTYKLHNTIRCEILRNVNNMFYSV